MFDAGRSLSLFQPFSLIIDPYYNGPVFALQFAESLVVLNYSKVCVLHKGIDTLRVTGLLTVPTPEL